MPTMPPRPTLAVLGFHKIGSPPPDGWESWFYIAETTFARQLEYLHEAGWHVVDAPTLLRYLAAPWEMPERTALLTFDDGYRSMHDVALAWLLRSGYPAVLFVPTDYVGRLNSFDGGEPREALCGWDELRTLARCGVSIQSHAASHRRFSELDAAALEDELARSQRTLQERLGTPVELLAYPYGDDGRDPRALDAALMKLGYRAAFVYGRGGGPVHPPIMDPYRIARIPMGPDTDLRALLEDA